MSYTTLLFDVDNTILDFTRCEWEAVGLVMKNNGIEPSDENIVYYSGVNDRFWKMFERGEIKKSEIYEGRFKAFLKEKGFNRDSKKISDEYIEALKTFHFPLDGALDMLERVSKKFEIYYTTNGNAVTQEKRIKNSGILNFAKGVFVSEAIGHQKPEKEYFDYVLENIPEKDKSRIIVIGDSMSSDILGGINSGLDTLWFNPTGEKAVYEPTYTAKNFAELIEILENS